MPRRAVAVHLTRRDLLHLVRILPAGEPVARKARAALHDVDEFRGVRREWRRHVWYHLALAVYEHRRGGDECLAHLHCVSAEDRATPTPPAAGEAPPVNPSTQD